MPRDRVSLLIAVALLCLLVGCGTVVRPVDQELKPAADSFLLQLSDGVIGSYSMNLSDGSISLRQSIHFPALGYQAGTDPLGRFAWIAQHDILEKDIFVAAPPTIITFARAADGLFFDSDRRDYQPKIEQIAVEHHGRWAYDALTDSVGQRRIFSISPGDGHLEEVGRTASGAYGAIMVLHPVENIFYGLEVRNASASAQGREIVVAAYASNEDTGELEPLPNVFTEIPEGIREMAFTSDGRHLVVADLNNQVHLLAKDSEGGLSEVGLLTPKFYVDGFVPHPKLPIIYHRSLEDGVVTSFGIDSGALAELPKIYLPNSGGAVFLLHVSSDGRFLLVQNKGVYLITLDSHTGAATAIQPVNFPFPY